LYTRVSIDYKEVPPPGLRIQVVNIYK
jgi:hypothetical protein